MIGWLTGWLLMAGLALASSAVEAVDSSPLGDDHVDFWTLHSSAKSFAESFLVIVISEIGDKTFLIAAVLAMRNNRVTILAAAASALLIMTVLSAILGHVLPSLFRRDVTQVLAGLLFLFFGFKMMREGLEMDPNEGTQKEMAEVEEELAIRSSSMDDDRAVEEGMGSPSHSHTLSWQDSFRNLMQFVFSPVFAQTFVMTFLAEWGDRSQIATIALAAAENVVYVTIGASIAHVLCTAAAVAGGRFLATKISVRTVTISGAALFLLFGVTTLYFCIYGGND
eukprot:Partr_v1_DN24601_c0_g1_i2_m59541 putative transmembrane protein 165